MKNSGCGNFVKTKDEMNFYRDSEGGFISFFALVMLMILSFVSCGLFFIVEDGIKIERRRETAAQLRLDAMSAIEKIAYDIENKNIEIYEDIENGGEQDLTEEIELDIGENKSVKAAAKYERDGLRVLAVVEKEDEGVISFATAECFLEKTDGGYKWKYWIKTR